MSSIGELIAQLAAEKQRADELEAEIARSNALADEMVEQLRAIGFDTKAALISEAKTRAGQAQNARWLAEGHLEDAIRVLQAVIDGQKGVGTKIPGGAADTGGTTTGAGSGTGATKPDHGPLLKADDKSFVTEWEGRPVKITYADPEPEHEPGPSGDKLLEESKSSAKLSGFRSGARGAVRNIDDIQAYTREVGKGLDALDGLDDTTGTKTEALTIQDCVPEVLSFASPPPPPPSPTIADNLVHIATLGIGVLEAAMRARRSRREQQ